jgi:poly-gamma-glutamate synthesis protein (capsule biosynthesis protein)
MGVGVTNGAARTTGNPHAITLFLSGDVMPGRGIDQVLPHPSSPRLYERYVIHAGDYVALAERKNGPLPRPLDYDYIWGDALALLDRYAPDVRIINLETAVTASDAYWKGKGINYRMHPGNIRSLTAARIDCCVLANNHVLDWGYRGLTDTLDVLHASGMQTAGAGADRRAAQRPAILEVAGKGRVLVFAFGHGSSGIPPEWAATNGRAGVALLEHLSEEAVRQIADLVNEVRLSGDIVVASIHWGGNWGYVVPREQQLFARLLIDEAGIDVVHGHSSHHPRGIEVYQGKPILYGCGDLLNDYEGINGYEEFRGELSLLYLPSLDAASGTLLHFELIPMAIRRFRLNRPSTEEVQWLCEMLNREGEKFGTRVQISEGGRLLLSW